MLSFAQLLPALLCDAPSGNRGGSQRAWLRSFHLQYQRDARLEEKYLRMIRAMAPQGIIYACNPHPDYISQVEEMARSIPLVIISNKEKISTVDAINQDNTEVGRLMARHLLDLGHRDVAFITPPLTRRQWQRSKRVDGFVREFEKAGLSGHVIIRAADESVDRRNPKTIPSILWAMP